MNKEKYRNAILYFIENVPNLGITKLYKLLYFLDFDHFEKYGASVTGDDYQNMELGPVPVNGEQILNEMTVEGLIEIVPERVIDFVRYTLVSKTHHNPSTFEASETEMLCDIKDKWIHHTAKEVVLASHGEAPWIATRQGDIIPYALAYYRGKFERPSYDEEPLEIIA